jgi:hypothetical protein
MGLALETAGAVRRDLDRPSGEADGMRADTKTVLIMATVFLVALALLTVARCDLALGS